MRKWWRKFKNKHGWDFKKISTGGRWIRRVRKDGSVSQKYDENGIYIYECSYCGLSIRFPWRETALAYHNIQRHIKAKHIDTL